MDFGRRTEVHFHNEFLFLHEKSKHIDSHKRFSRDLGLYSLYSPSMFIEKPNRYHGHEVIAYNAVLVTCRALLCWSLALELLDVMVRKHSWMGKVGDCVCVGTRNEQRLRPFFDFIIVFFMFNIQCFFAVPNNIHTFCNKKDWDTQSLGRIFAEIVFGFSLPSVSFFASSQVLERLAVNPVTLEPIVDVLQHLGAFASMSLCFSVGLGFVWVWNGDTQ